jgi:exosortase
MQKPDSPQPIYRLAAAKITGNVALILKASTITLIVLLLYFQDLSIVFNDAMYSETTAYILAIPFLFAYLLYRKRKMIAANVEQEKPNMPERIKHFHTVVGALLCTTAVTAYWRGSYTFTPLEYHMLTLPIFAAGLTLILFNAQVLRQLAFPIVFLIFLTPPPAELLYSVGSALSVTSAEAANVLVNAFHIPSVISSEYGNPLITLTRPDNTVMKFTVDIACSGIYSLIGFVIFALFIAYITRGRMRNKPVIMLMGIPLVIALNIIRITTILAIGYHYGEQLALQVFHTLGATVFMFLGTLLLLAITEKAFKSPQPKQPSPNCNPHPPNLTETYCPNCGRLLKTPHPKLRRNDLAKIASLALIIAVLLSIQAPVFALTEGPAQVIIQTPSGERGNTEILPQIQGYTLQFVYRDEDFEHLVGEDASLVYAYVPTDQTKLTVWVAVEVAQTRSPLHRWETCLVNYPLSRGYQPRITQLDLKDIQTLANPPIFARYFAFQYRATNQTQLVLYWYETSVFTTNGASQQKHVKMSLVTFPQTPQLVAEAEPQLLPFATAINDYWQPIKTWTQIALTISQNGLALSASTAALLVVVLFYLAFLNRQEMLSLLKLHEKLPEQDKLLIEAVRQTAKNGKTTTLSNIASQLQELAKTPVSTTQLSEKLQEAANAGLIEKTIANDADQPTIHWKKRVPEKTFSLKLLHIDLHSLYRKLSLSKRKQTIKSNQG